MKGTKTIAAYIEGIYAAADAIKAGVKIQNAEEIIDAANIFSITKKFRRGEAAPTAWDVRETVLFWLDAAATARVENKPACAKLYDRTARTFLGILQACQG